MTDHEALTALSALAGVPLPWFRPGVPALHYYQNKLSTYCICEERSGDTIRLLFTHDYCPGPYCPGPGSWQARAPQTQRWMIHFPRRPDIEDSYRPCPPGEGPCP